MMKTNNVKVERIVVGPLFSNCYLVWDDSTKEGVVIDPGDDAQKILKRIKQIGIKIKYILVTHGHFDHVGAVSTIKKETEAEFLAHRNDYVFIKDAESSACRWGVIIKQPPEPDGFIEDGDIISVDGFELKVIHTPGHSPGGVSFLYNNMVFCGDTLFQGSIGRTDFRMGSFEELSESIKNRLYTLSDDTIVYTGHGPPTTIGDEKRFNPFVRE